MILVIGLSKQFGVVVILSVLYWNCSDEKLSYPLQCLEQAADVAKPCKHVVSFPVVLNFIVGKDHINPYDFIVIWELIERASLRVHLFNLVENILCVLAKLDVGRIIVELVSNCKGLYVFRVAPKELSLWYYWNVCHCFFAKSILIENLLIL